MKNRRWRKRRQKKSKKQFKRYKGSRMSFSNSLTLRRPTVFPDKYNVKLVYSDKNDLAGAANDYMIYRGAGAYDPDYIFAGRYCKGWTTLSTIYQKYVTRACKIECKIISTGGGVNLVTSGLFVILPSQAPLVLSTTPSYQLMDEPYARSCVVGGAGGTSTAYLKNYITYNKMVGKTNDSNLQDDVNAVAWTNKTVATGGVPNNDWYWHIIASSIDGSNLNQITVFVKLTYYLTFFERVDLFGATDDNGDNETNPGPEGPTGPYAP